MRCCRARAIENGAWVIAAAQGGLHEDGRETYGHSLVVDPWGRVVAELASDEPGIVYAEIDTAAVARGAREDPESEERARVRGDGGAPANRDERLRAAS